MQRIAIDCLNCGHVASISEVSLAHRGYEPGTSLVALTRKFICQECGSKAVRAYRYDEEPTLVRRSVRGTRMPFDGCLGIGTVMTTNQPLSGWAKQQKAGLDKQREAAKQNANENVGKPLQHGDRAAGEPDPETPEEQGGIAGP